MCVREGERKRERERERESNHSRFAYKERWFLELQKYDGFSEACRENRMTISNGFSCEKEIE